MRRTRRHAWDEVWRTLEEEGVCISVGRDEYVPCDTHTGINYGLEVARAVTDLQNYHLPRDAIDAVNHLVAWVAKSARR